MKNFKDYNRISDLLLDIVAGDIIISQYDHRQGIVFVSAFLGQEQEIDGVGGYYSISLPECNDDDGYTQIHYKIDKHSIKNRIGRTFIKKFDMLDVIKPEDFFINHPIHFEVLFEVLNRDSYLDRKIIEEYEKNPNMAHLIDAQKFNL